MNYEDMSDFEINKWIWRLTKEGWVMRCCGRNIYNDSTWSNEFDPCNNPSDAWPIIVENGIGIHQQHDMTWFASWSTGEIDCVGINPLRAAMICFLKMKDADK